jgi:hypothetical protein
MRGPGALLELQLAPLDFEVVAARELFVQLERLNARGAWSR